jgi:intein/homing endonuclease
LNDIKKINFDDAWLGLGDLSKISIPTNPMIHRSETDIENPDLHLLKLFRDPKYIGSMVKLLLNIELHPIQVAIIQEFWIRAFPMYIASRGWGKSFLLALYCVIRCAFFPGTKIVVVGAAFRQSKIIFEYMETIWRNSPILRSIFNGNDDGPRRDVDRCTMRLGDSWTIAIPMGDGCLTPDTMVTFSNCFSTLGSMFDLEYEGELNTVNSCEIWDNCKFEKSFHKRYNGLKDTIKITTKRGFSLEGTYNHEVKVFDGNSVVWKRLDNININDQILIDATERWHQGITQITIDEAYALGLMIGDGSWTNKYRLRYTSKDPELVLALEKGTGYKFYQCADKVHYNHDGIKNVKDWMNKWEIDHTRTKDKYLPKPILSSSQEVMSACLRGIFDTDGHVQGNKAKGGVGITISLTNTSKELVYQIHYILLHYGIVSTLKSRERKNEWNTIYELLINGKNVKKFAEKINFGLERKKQTLLKYISEKQRWSSQEKYQDGYLLDTVKTINYDKNYTYDLEVENSHQYNANGICVHNSKIRGLRAHIIIADEFASISPDIYETVVSGFAAVSASPIQNVKDEAKKKAMIEAGLWNDELEALEYKMGNQAIISGTADYNFKHFAQYWKRYKSIIESKGDDRKLQEIFKGEVPSSFNWKDYSIIRIPYELIPKGFMDDKQVSRAKATIHTGIYNMEYAACFVKDSEGFFRRSLIESCVTSDKDPIIINGKTIAFDLLTHGYHDRQYVYGIDPASEQDNFSIIILEIHADHRRVVYGWTTNRSNFKVRLKTGLIKEYDFYGFCARKIRNLMKIFPPVRIGMDAQGGGVAIEEALHDPSKIEEGEHLIWPIIDYDKAKDTDNQSGLHIIELVQFAKADWTSQANHGLRKDLEDKILLFPKFDNLTLGLALDKEGKDILDSDLNPIYDSLSECILEIEELKNELTTIVMTQTSTGPNARDRWDTPEVKLQNGRKGRLRKDRYSSLIIANMLARQMSRSLQAVQYDVVGDNRLNMVKQEGNMYKGPEWFTSGANDADYLGIYK